MHFVTGGAFNGKKKWVTTTYHISADNCSWFSGYNDSSIKMISSIKELSSITVIEGLEQFVKNTLTHSSDLEEVRDFWKALFIKWHKWESEADTRTLIVIGQDMSKGIVPIHKQDRNWRDLVGWCYQDLTQTCDKVTTIWYGISQPLKGECE
ncbi:bifunctional adenosylcobinamide kinase/adenosylcobinamide-phosphate guanylyltransferase [Bacillus taeanensis]|uniref:Uncharacterized protein n=1 Tax=Bacillus taeanensis TaxID=273032 RepID=A0A366XYV5_9BACI|nr:bifunctional adenosylcobinamide kinase/adenosylcobinamide-phosphate guanylyltransferase [Bacillus taeanensis]RBW70325.1 hypothetical protein DS031_07085 [Bacillus taeanensis]